MRIGWRRTIGPVAVLIVAWTASVTWRDGAAASGLSDGGLASEVIRVIAEGSVWLAGAVFVMRLLNILVWNGVILRRTGSAATRLLTDLVNGLILVSAFAAIIAFVLDKPVTGLIATSGVAVAVVGFALKSMISDLFSGIAITLERPFRMGDWIEITGGTVGKVLNISWRATGLLLGNGNYVVVPNGRLSEMVIKVYDRPATPWRDEIDITLGYDVTAYQVERILLSAAMDVPQVAAQPKAPDVRIIEFGDNGVKWRLRFWVPDYPNQGPIRYAVQRNVLRNLHFSGIETPVARIDARVSHPTAANLSSRGTEAFLGRVSLFNMLEAEEVAELTQSVAFRLALAGTAVVRRNEAGASLFLVKEGLCEVLIPDGDGTERSVAHLKPGAFFGEMSLLTGAPRSATVRAVVDSMVIEIAKEALQPILSRREAVVEAMSNALAERQLHNDRAAFEGASSAEAKIAHQTLAGQLLGRMRSFFGLGVTAEKPRIPAEIHH
ncbi:MAG: MscS Mechanosensitive ion channel [Rhodospirillales bacterium]|nr:MscS Mechanosensitive ion channel [Rhodospirillales bacterium]